MVDAREGEGEREREGENMTAHTLLLATCIIITHLGGGGGGGGGGRGIYTIHAPVVYVLPFSHYTGDTAKHPAWIEKGKGRVWN